MAVSEVESTVYRLKRFTSSDDKDFLRALKIYLENTDHNIITSTNEITYGLDFYNSKFSDLDFTALGLYLNKILIGYCQLVYFKEEKLVFIDYLVIDKSYRRNNTFYEFIEKIKEYFDAKDFHPFYIIVEVSLQGASTERESPGKTRHLIRLLKMNNFGLIGSPYFQPMLGVTNYESNLDSILMLYPADEHKAIKRETFLMILKTVYFKHYKRWYDMFLSEKEATEYSIHLHDLFGKISEHIKAQPSISLESYTDLDYDKSSIKPQKMHRKVLYFLLGFVGLIIFIGIISFVLKRGFNMEYKDQFYFLIFVSGFYLAVLSLFSDKASGIVNRAIEKSIDKIT